MRVVLKGVHRVKRKLANGEMKVHFYAWRGGPAIEAKPGSPEFVREYHDAHASLRQPRAGTFMTIIAQYKAAPEFTGLAASTRRAYLAYIKLIEDELVTYRWQLWPTVACVVNSKPGATRSPRRPVRRTMPGRR